MNSHCAWCGNLLMDSERHGDVCNECLNGKVCDGCKLPLAVHVGGEGCPDLVKMWEDMPADAKREAVRQINIGAAEQIRR